MIKDSGEEMLQYQAAFLAQQVYFDPTVPFERRLFGKDVDLKKPSFQQPNYQLKKNQLPKEPEMNADKINIHTIPRVKGKINDFIITNYV